MIIARTISDKVLKSLSVWNCHSNSGDIIKKDNETDIYINPSDWSIKLYLYFPLLLPPLISPPNFK